MLTYEEWLNETGRENSEEAYWEYLDYVKHMKEDLRNMS